VIAFLASLASHGPAIATLGFLMLTLFCMLLGIALYLLHRRIAAEHRDVLRMAIEDMNDVERAFGSTRTESEGGQR
jgi:hypothetical protein